MNAFLVKNGTLLTPPGTDNILEGITRSTVMEIARQEFGIETVIRSIDRSELYLADELFFCGTGAQIAPIIEIDRRTVGNGAPGTITTKIRDTYIDLCRGNLPAYHKWLTPVYCGSNGNLGGSFASKASSTAGSIV
jgi:branched-chain amino acid aminotransferase